MPIVMKTIHQTEDSADFFKPYEEKDSNYGRILNRTYDNPNTTNELRLLLVFIDSKLLLEIYSYLDLLDIAKTQFTCKLFANAHLPKYLRFELQVEEYKYRAKIYEKELEIYQAKMNQRSSAFISPLLPFAEMEYLLFCNSTRPRSPGKYPQYKLDNDQPEGQGFTLNLYSR